MNEILSLLAVLLAGAALFCAGMRCQRNVQNNYITNYHAPPGEVWNLAEDEDDEINETLGPEFGDRL